ncbi:Lreu_0056 family protein [Limosilactobacillus sp.]|jgi:hypothetical protein|uniref:Lreu_0056 family protein n=1 Tax=Limosilactobacillus sp. TaxID=2773925 RepID=UPI0025BFF3EB|nr:hypothetical protein [Limosilactobacillus sp.]MCH3922935.1 hypothetical protein [Limosilactobacillus sp.]MCH3927618.1 hypothetical protein [Limosilactobacillus sp.]
MKKLTLAVCLSMAVLTLSGCGQNSHKTAATSSSSAVSKTQSSSSSRTDSASLDADHLTPQQNAALVMYYRNAQMPGASKHDYSADMKLAGQTATVKIYDKDSVPKGVGPLYKSYPDGAQLLYSVKLQNNHGNDGKHFDSTYYTIAGDKVYYEDADAGISTNGVTSAEMVDYAKSHGGVDRVLNVAKGMKVVDLRGQNSSSESTAKNSQDLSPQQLGVLVALYQSPDWFKEFVDDGMYYGTQQDMQVGPEGYDYITAYGDPTSYVYFKRSGNDVTIKQVVPKGNQSVADASMVTKHVTVSGLIRDYYTNQSQKDEVNGYVNELKPISDVANH